MDKINQLNSDLSHYELEKTSSKVEFSAYSDDYKNSMILGHATDGNYYCKSRFDGTWDTVNLATKDDLNKRISSRVSIDWSNNPAGLLFTIDGDQKRLIPNSAMQILK